MEQVLPWELPDTDECPEGFLPIPAPPHFAANSDAPEEVRSFNELCPEDLELGV